MTTIKFTSSHANYMYCSLSKAQPEATSFVLKLKPEAADSVLDLQSLGFRVLGFAFGFYTHAGRTTSQVHVPEAEVPELGQNAHHRCVSG